MSNTRLWRSKKRTAKPNSRQKRNGLFLDAHPQCQRCGRARSAEAHHNLPVGNPGRYDWPQMMALCRPCHTRIHQTVVIIVTPAMGLV